MAQARKQPLDFRKEEVEYLAQRWLAATSCSLVGIGSVGKSNLLQHLSEPDVLVHYLGDHASQFKTIIIDANMLGALSADKDDAFRCWAGYELMMHRLFLAFYPFDILPKDEAVRFYEAYQALQDGTNPLFAYMGLRYFELGLEYFMRRGVSIVFMFDEFEEFLRQLPVKFFQTLRGLRDANKRQLMYVTFSRSPLPALVERYNLPALDMEPFVELFTDNTCYVGPYNPVDGKRMLDNLSKRRQKNYPENATAALAQATGRYAGLMRAGFAALEEVKNVDLDSVTASELTTILAAKPTVRAECKTIWTSLNRSEQVVLKAVARLTPYNVSAETEQAVSMLVQKRLLKLDKSEQRLEIVPPVFRAYVLTNPDSS